jgi:hypothetical protein
VLISVQDMSLPVPDEDEFCASARDAPLHPLQLKRGMIISVTTPGGELQGQRTGTVQHIYQSTGGLNIKWDGDDMPFDSMWPLNVEQLKSVPYECDSHSQSSGWGQTPIVFKSQSNCTMQCPWSPHEVLLDCLAVGIDMDQLTEGQILAKNSDSLQNLLQESKNSKRAVFLSCTFFLFLHLCYFTYVVCL